MRKYTMLVRKHLAGWVRRTRALEELTQEKMSEQLRMSTRAYSNLELEKNGLSAATLMFFLSILPQKDILQLIEEFQKEFHQVEENEDAP